MSFIKAIESGVKKSFDFKGRASRSEFNYWILFSYLFLIISIMINEILAGLIILTFIPSISISVRRLHDLDKTGWWILALMLLPFAIIYLMVKKGTIGKNSYDKDLIKDKSLMLDEPEEQEQKSEPPSTDDSEKRLNEQESKSSVEQVPTSIPETTNQVASLYDKFPHLNEEPKEFNFGKIMGLPFFTLMLAFDDDGDEQEQEVIGNIMREVWGVPVFTSAEKADEMFNELAVWYNALNELPEHGTNEKYAIIEWVIESLKHPSGLVEQTMMDLMVHKGEIAERSSSWGPKYFMESLIKIANANNKVTDDERSFLIWCAEHLGYDIDFNTLTFTTTQSSEPPLTPDEPVDQEQKIDSPRVKPSRFKSEK